MQSNEKIKFKAEVVKVDQIKKHPKNYRTHPDDQLDHLVQSIKEHGFYKNIVVSKDNIILSGHGVYEASLKLGLSEIPIIRIDINSEDPKALKILVGDNEIAKLAEIDDRQLTELLKEINELDINKLLGTGYDEMMLANLVFISRPADEIKDINEAKEWVGMPEFLMDGNEFKLIINFINQENKTEFINKMGLNISPKSKTTWWPERQKDDVSSVRFEVENNNETSN